MGHVFSRKRSRLSRRPRSGVGGGEGGGQACLSARRCHQGNAGRWRADSCRTPRWSGAGGVGGTLWAVQGEQPSVTRRQFQVGKGRIRTNSQSRSLTHLHILGGEEPGEPRPAPAGQAVSRQDPFLPVSLDPATETLPSGHWIRNAIPNTHVQPEPSSTAPPFPRVRLWVADGYPGRPQKMPCH